MYAMIGNQITVEKTTMVPTTPLSRLVFSPGSVRSGMAKKAAMKDAGAKMMVTKVKSCTVLFCCAVSSDCLRADRASVTVACCCFRSSSCKIAACVRSAFSSIFFTSAWPSRISASRYSVRKRRREDFHVVGWPPLLRAANCAMMPTWVLTMLSIMWSSSRMSLTSQRFLTSRRMLVSSSSAVLRSSRRDCGF